ncbi:MAG TPA: hypothetical protein VLY46_01005, partial [Usitatibacter sp.]|nr:hypothetical protein [Usitatibacter sp.]
RAGQPRWLVEALARVACSDFAELCYVAIDVRGAAGLAEPMPWRAYRALDRRLFGRRSDPSATADIRALVAPERRIDAAKAMPVDVAFVLGAADDAAPAGLARYGAWRYCFGEGRDTHEALAALREVLEAQPVAGSALRIRRNGEPVDRIACASWSRTVAFSFARTRDTLLAKSTDFLARSLRELHAQGAAWIEHSTDPAPPADRAAYPGGTALASGLARLAARVAHRTVERSLTIDQWQIAWRFADVEPWSGSLDGFHRLVPPRDRFWADPFPIEVNGRHYVFFEELPFAAGKAHISVVEVDRSGRVSEPAPALVRDYHLSYPFLVQEGGALYMIPETAHNRTVEAYRCIEFPYKWKLARVLLPDVWCADATLHRTGDGWWMFASFGADGGEVNDELRAFRSERLLGEWKPHRSNPVKSDVRGARPAGRLFRHGDALYRPGQICTPIYGAGIALHRVTRMDERGYAEEEVRRILPSARDAVLGMHTINRAGALSVTDYFLRRPRFGSGA